MVKKGVFNMIAFCRSNCKFYCCLILYIPFDSSSNTFLSQERNETLEMEGDQEAVCCQVLHFIRFEKYLKRNSLIMNISRCDVTFSAVGKRNSLIV